MKKLFWICSTGVLLTCLTFSHVHLLQEMDLGLHHNGQVLILEGLGPDAVDQHFSRPWNKPFSSLILR